MAEEKKTKKKVFGNCGGCNKVINKIRRYYRNAKYFCTKRCYKAYLAKAAEQKEGPA